MSIKYTVKVSGQNKSRALPSGITIGELPMIGDWLTFADIGRHVVIQKTFFYDSNNNVEGIEFDTEPL